MTKTVTAASALDFSTHTYEQQFEAKYSSTLQQLAPYTSAPIQAFKSSDSGFRMRAEFKIWHEGDTLVHAMYEKGGNHKIIKLSEFKIAHSNINALMAPLLDALQKQSVLKRKLFQIDYLTTTTGDTLATLIYHKTLTKEWEQAVRPVAKSLGIKIMGRSRGQKWVLTHDYVLESFVVQDRTLTYQQLESGFTQPNAEICQTMLNWAFNAMEKTDRDLLELYCGNGNFTLPLSLKFNKVLATEIAKSSIESARFNCDLNQVKNIEFIRMSSEDFTQALNGVREFNRLQHLSLSDYDFSTVFVDPPRSGLDDDTCRLVSRFDNILYISCNPDTLCGNLAQLTTTHEVAAAAMFDQFPFTPHREVGVYLKKK